MKQIVYNALRGAYFKSSDLTSQRPHILTARLWLEFHISESMILYDLNSLFPSLLRLPKSTMTVREALRYRERFHSAQPLLRSKGIDFQLDSKLIA